MSLPLRLWTLVVSAAVGLLAGYLAYVLWEIRHVIPTGLKVGLIAGGVIGLLVGLAVTGAAGVEIRGLRKSGD